MTAVQFIGAAALWAVLVLGPLALLLAGLYYVLSLPMRRWERARMFLDLLETGMASGQSPDRVLISASASRDPTLGMRFHWLAALVETGRPLAEALAKVPRFLPPRMVSMLQVGLELGEVRRVLPACRHQLQDGVSMVRGAMNYAVVLALAMTWAAPGVMAVLARFVFPKIREIGKDMGVAMPLLLDQWLGPLEWLALAGGLATKLLLIIALLYVGGPHVARWFNLGPFRLADRVTWWLPWKRTRLRRDYVGLLAVLLDSGIAEARAVELAAVGVGHSVLQGRARRAVEDLKSGKGLRTALGRLDESAEFAWRLGNVEAGRAGFGVALASWLECLDARAFRLEQATAHVVTTALVLMNGMVVGLIVVATFGALISIVNEAVLW